MSYDPIKLSGDITGSGVGVVTTTLATVNSNVGSFTATNLTVNAKGLITAAASGGTLSFAANTVSSSTVSGVAGNAYFASTASNAMTFTLPTAVGIGGQFVFISLQTAGNTLTINTTSSQTIDGVASGSLQTSTQYDSYWFLSTGSNWCLL
jgi:hypothetical protein